MPVTKVRSSWESGDLVFKNTSGTEILRIDGTNAQVKINTVAIDSATLDELAALGGLTASVAELNLIDGSLAGTSVASKALSLGANKNTDVLALPVSGLKIGAAAGTAVDRTAAELNALAQGVAAGYRVARGVAAVTGTATVATGLTTVVAVIACPQSDPDGVALAAVSATIGDQAGAPVAGSVILKTWKVTATGNATLIAATAAQNLNWIAIGT